MTKAALRRAMLRRLKRQSSAARRRKSAAILRQVLALPALRRARTVMCYCSLPYEVQTDGLIRACLRLGKRVALPVAVPSRRRLIACAVRNPRTELRPGAHGIREPRLRRPVPVRQLGLILVPGVLFDRRGGRLGHGGGYYDRFLRQVPRRIPRVGLAYALQVVDRLPVQRHDQRVDMVIDDTGT